MRQPITADPEAFLAQLNAAVAAYRVQTQGRRPQGTKTWLAEQLGCDRTTLYKYLDGTNRIPLASLQLLTKLLGLDETVCNTLIVLGGYGVAVPVAPPESLTVPAASTTKIAPNPFGRRGRIDDPAEFFGREELLRQIFEELGKGSNLSLIGPREIGKSSLLAMIQHRSSAQPGISSEAVLQIDMQLIHSDEDFFEALCAELGLTRLYRGYHLARQLTGRRYILCLDEIEKMRRDRFSAEVREELRGLSDGSTAPLTLVVASGQPLAELFPDKLGDTSPLANICHPLEVPPFKRAEARDFLATRLAGTGISFDEEEIAELLEQSGRHPARLQQAAAALYRQKSRG
ncbi:AAA family ATPase [Candidatus Chloroploca asiatica]|uniref:HTH cro/C1-type domain-containing protein n=1 Tax=Candidatus Chloroploca asiatica TaxID=1506545 RepID=A0A2H3KH10_9CHLR|nr:AAA family ATPase [Candidatus Chloroploca asiatica]PDV97033.1 hypothetical protein A9Q02_19690 [Candidatus Chloroploca asiatica]